MTQTVFIFSTGRTGTKFLANYFNISYDNVLALHEPTPSYLLRICGNAYLDGKLSEKQLLAILNHQRMGVRAQITQTIPDFYIEATPFIYGIIDVLEQFSDNPIVFHIVRDPREFVRSAHNHSSYRSKKMLATKLIPYWFPPARKLVHEKPINSVQLASAKWVYVNQKLAQGGAKIKNYHIIKFEDLFDDSASGLQRICTILGLDFLGNDATVSPTTRVNQGKASIMGRWQTWSNEQCRHLAMICTPMMKIYGYGNESEWLEKVQP